MRGGVKWNQKDRYVDGAKGMFVIVQLTHAGAMGAFQFFTKRRCSRAPFVPDNSIR